MADVIVVLALAATARLVYSLVSLCTSAARERAGARAIATVLRAAGPGDMVRYARPDGPVEITRAGDR